MPAGPASLDGYQLRLPMFEGPLDVLLRLIERSQLAITDVSLIAVTGQFLEHLASLGGAPPQVVAEFTAVGSRLVLLKSRSLLPRPVQDAGDDVGDDLLQQLIEYRSVKEAAGHLALRVATGEEGYGRGNGAVARPENPAPRLGLHEPGALVRAIRRRLAVLPAPREAMRTRRLISLREMIERILTLVPHRGAARFSTVAGACGDRQEVLTAFLGLLILIRRRVVDAEQPVPFGEIAVQRTTAEPVRLSDHYDGQAADD